MRITIRPLNRPERELDVTHRLVAAIAEELWREFGGNGQLNWVEAEFHLSRMLGETEAAARVGSAGARATRTDRRKRTTGSRRPKAAGRARGGASRTNGQRVR